MKLYDCKVRVMGDVRDEVRKHHVTQAEITVLRRIHGDDAVSEIVYMGDTDRSEHDERDRLNASYGSKTIDKIFGVPVARIADELPTFTDVEDTSSLASLPEAKRTNKVGRPRKTPEAEPVPEVIAAAVAAPSSIGTLTD